MTESQRVLRRARQRKWYRERGRAKQIKKAAARKKQIVAWYKAYKSTLKCSRCPMNHPAALDFHHRDPKMKELDIASVVANGYSIKRLLKEIEKCDVLCANCHRIEEAERRKKSLQYR